MKTSSCGMLALLLLSAPGLAGAAELRCYDLCNTGETGVDIPALPEMLRGFILETQQQRCDPTSPDLAVEPGAPVYLGEAQGCDEENAGCTGVLARAQCLSVAGNTYDEEFRSCTDEGGSPVWHMMASLYQYRSACLMTDAAEEPPDDDDDDDHNPTCGDVKEAYKMNGCCGNPSKEFHMDMPEHRRLSGADDVASATKAYLWGVQMSRGRAAASKAAASVRGALQAYL